MYSNIKDAIFIPRRIMYEKRAGCMIRNKLRKFPALYSLFRFLHIMLINVMKLPERVKLGLKTKKELVGIEENDGGIIWFLCIPRHNNLGDYAQYKCIQMWIKNNYPEYKSIEIPSEPIHYDFCGVLRLLKALIKKDDIIVFQSGYTSTDLHIDEKVHRKIVGNFKNNLLLFFPQTVNYSSEKELMKTAQLYNQANKLLFLARDRKSYNTIHTVLKTGAVYLYPDIATSWIGSTQFDRVSEKNGILFCIRDDSEKLFDNNSIKGAFKEILSPDTEVAWLDTTLGKEQSCSLDIIQEYIYKFSKYELIVTDRFHGTIFSLIANTPVVVLKTADHKVSEGAEWFTKIYPEYIRMAADLKDAADKAQELLSIIQRDNINPIFKEKYYDTLKDKVDKIKN